MTRKSVAEKNIESKFWKPEKIGDKIEGEYSGCEEGKYGLEYVLKTPPDGEEKVLPAHKVLQAKMEELKVGWYVWVEVTGYKQTNKGNPTTLYKVEYDDEYKHQATLDKAKESVKDETQAHVDAKAQGIADKIKQLTEDGVTVTAGVLETVVKMGLGTNDTRDSEKMIRILKHKGLIIRNDADTGWIAV